MKTKKTAASKKTGRKQHKAGANAHDLSTLLQQARAVAYHIMLGDEVPHSMAEDMNCAASVVCDLLEQAVKEEPEISEINDAYAIATLIVVADQGEEMQDEIARAASVIWKLLDETLEELEPEKKAA